MSLVTDRELADDLRGALGEARPAYREAHRADHIARLADCTLAVLIEAAERWLSNTANSQRSEKVQELIEVMKRIDDADPMNRCAYPAGGGLCAMPLGHEGGHGQIRQRT